MTERSSDEMVDRPSILALGAYRALTLTGLSFASVTTIVAAFAADLGASNTVLGLLPALMIGGWFLPSLFAARYIEALRHRLPFVIRWRLLFNSGFLLLAAAGFLAAPAHPSWALLLVVAGIALIYGVNGMIEPVVVEVAGRIVPTDRRGRFMAGSNLMGNLGAVAGSLLTAKILTEVTGPAGYGWCFAIGLAIAFASFACLLPAREPPAAALPDRQSLRQFLAAVPEYLRADRNLIWFLVARSAALIGTMAAGLFAAYGLRNFDAPSWYVGAFTSALIAGQIVGNPIFGWLADRAGHKAVVGAGFLAVAACNLTALAAPTIEIYVLVFAFTGLQLAAVGVSAMNLVLDLCPAEEARPAYLGMGNTLLTPIAFVAPIAAGGVADIVGVEPIFIAGAIAAVGATVALLVKVQIPPS